MAKVLEVNIWQQKNYEIIVEKLFNTISGKKICILGFAFKANTNDTRESPAIEICKNLMEEGCNICIYDPKVSRKTVQNEFDLLKKNNTSLRGAFCNWDFFNNIYEAAKDSDAIVILTEWSEFKNLDFKKLSEIMRPLLGFLILDQ